MHFTSVSRCGQSITWILPDWLHRQCPRVAECWDRPLLLLGGGQRLGLWIQKLPDAPLRSTQNRRICSVPTRCTITLYISDPRSPLFCSFLQTLTTQKNLCFRSLFFVEIKSKILCVCHYRLYIIIYFMLMESTLSWQITYNGTPQHTSFILQIKASNWILNK